jgi:hypothetical protein
MDLNRFWVKNTNGEPSASLTLVLVAFSVVILHMTAAVFVNPFGLAIAPFVASDAMMVLTPLLGLYFGRRYTDKDVPSTATVSSPKRRR